MTRIVKLLTLAAVVMGSSVSPAADFDQSHAVYAKVLARHVKKARVDYAGLKKNPSELDAYLQEIASVSPSTFKKWTEPQRLALLLNLYNAQTLRLIIDHYPLKSIREIGFLPGAAWRIQNVRFGGKIMTLDHLENGIIRTEYNEPRIHFALVCAAISCPPLRGEPFVAEKLDGQLNDQARAFLATPEKNRFEPESNTLWLSKIFDWYTADFTKPAGSLEHYVQPFLPATTAGALKSAPEVKVRFTDYDWSLNEQER